MGHYTAGADYTIITDDNIRQYADTRANPDIIANRNGIGIFKARIALCKVLLQRANFLVLDEPTNHLDPETQSIIGGNFHLFEGTIMAVSHNPWFVEQLGINRVLILPSGRIVNYSRELLEYYYGLNSEEEL